MLTFAMKYMTLISYISSFDSINMHQLIILGEGIITCRDARKYIDLYIQL